jgi:hypothetical protein
LTDIQLFISIGGDGTLLESVTHIGRLEIPILGINTGRLGFLATISKSDTEDALKKFLQGSFTLDKRALLKLETNKDIFGTLNFALNDFTLVKKDSSAMITIHTYIDGEFLNSYWADGIIVANADWLNRLFFELWRTLDISPLGELCHNAGKSSQSNGEANCCFRCIRNNLSGRGTKQTILWHRWIRAWPLLILR